MRREVSASRLFRILLLAVTVLLVAYLAVLARNPAIRDHLPPGLKWFGEPASSWTIAIVVALIALVCVLNYRARRARRSAAAPIAIVAGLVATSVLLATTSYWDCYDHEHASFFTPLAWAASLSLGGGIDQRLDDTLCPEQVPVALEVARLSAIGAIAVGVVGVVVGLFQKQSDRIRARFAKSVTAVVGIDDDGVSMVAAVARTLERDSQLVLITASADRPCIHEVRNMGAAVIEFDQSRPETLESLRLWRKLDRLYVLSPDPTLNLLRLGIISRRLSAIGKKQRLPLIVRIDDPWQAEAWRAQQFGGSDRQWAADAVGKYEVTARRLLDRIIGGQGVKRIIVCGTSQLTLALCADMAQRRLERSYYADPTQPELPKLTLVGENADEYRQDHEFHQEQLGVPTGQLPIDVVSERPTVLVLTQVITVDPETDAVILVAGDPTGADTTVGTRLASRFPTMPIYAWDPNARVTEDRPPIVGQLRTYRLAMDLPAGHAQDAWERAAMLIHERYAADVGHDSPATQPWAQLDEFYRGSNRRQVANALWMVEQIAGHTWNTFGSGATSTPRPDMRRRRPLEQLQLMGFDRDAAMAMARAEHEAWCRYLRDQGWKYGPDRDNTRKIHNKLVNWDTVEGDSELLKTTLTRLATLEQLRLMGFNRDAALAMARAEHEDWYRYLRDWGWKYGPIRDDKLKIHNKFVNWDRVETDPELLNAALTSLATTLVKLAELGYRSRPVWERYRRTGTVTAEQRPSAWTWTSHTGQTMQANVGDWAVQDGDGDSWSVRDHIFRSTYQHIDGSRWRRTGFVEARRAREEETIDTLEGPVTTAEGDWVLRGAKGEKWAMPADDFAQRYEGPVMPADESQESAR